MTTLKGKPAVVTETAEGLHVTTLPWVAQVGTRRPVFFATREEAEAHLASSGKGGWVAPSFMVGGDQ